MGRNKGSQGLGRSLIKSQTQGRTPRGTDNFRHTTDLNNGTDWARLNLRSVTEQTNIDEFLATAELAGVEFTAEKENIKIISGKSIAALPTEQELSKIKDAQNNFRQLLKIPRRPLWDENTTPDELQNMERENFLTWRRSLADLQEEENILLTPYEKNLEFWRQLWRVVERSDIVVQIVDARNPLLFWCEDLDAYVKEVSSSKIIMLLLNKADFLTESQRQSWAKYFKECGVTAVFFSALSQLQLDEKESDNESSGSECDCEEVEDEEEEEIPFDSEAALANGSVFSREQLEIFWKSLPISQSVKENVTTVGLVGYPNVGKSSTINALLQLKKVSVSATPGKTKHFQTLMLSCDLCLCDCPGLVFPSFVSTKAEMIINGILPIDQMLQCIPPVALILIPAHILASTYGILLSEDPNKAFVTAEELLNAYGYMRGFMTQRGLPDWSRSARYVLKDFVNGKLLHCQAPPGGKQGDYHTFPLPALSSSAKPHITPTQHKLFHDGKVLSEDLDRKFFKKVSLGAHKKGDVASTSSDTDKPWRKHNNRNKKEKLRRVYSHLDQ